jgi:YgiT-type zinc finger domain-containing protein
VEQPIFCDLCGKKGVKVRHVARSYGKGERVMVIDDVPLLDCPNCGKSYMTPETLQRLERIKANCREKI